MLLIVVTKLFQNISRFHHLVVTSFPIATNHSSKKFINWTNLLYSNKTFWCKIKTFHQYSPFFDLFWQPLSWVGSFFVSTPSLDGFYSFPLRPYQLTTRKNPYIYIKITPKHKIFTKLSYFLHFHNISSFFHESNTILK